MRFQSTLTSFASVALLGALPARVAATQVLTTSSFTTCGSDSNITVTALDVSYNADNEVVTFNVAGTSAAEMNVTATMNVVAYGINVYSNSFNPCASNTYVEQLCPVPSGTFSASGTQAIPSEYASQIPSIAFTIPDIDAQATMTLKSIDADEDVACVEADVGNGKTVAVPAVSYVAAGVAAVALAAGAASAVGAAAAGGTTGGFGTASPSFGEVMGWFQGMAMNGMMTVNYPDVYRSFAKNFGFSTGIIPWTAMQTSIDNFRAATGGNLTDDNVQYLKNATLEFQTSSSSSKRSLIQRQILTALYSRDVVVSASNSTDTSASNSTLASSTNAEVQHFVSGIQAYVEELSVPQANTFMTVLLIVSIVIATIAVGILLVKLVIEIWALFASFPKSLTGFRKHYWRTMARTITQLVLILYGTWVLYCIYQFTNGDSWAAKLLAGVTLALFTGVLAFFTFKIWRLAQISKRSEGDASALYDKKDNWLKYSIFYDSYKKDCWWLFVPVIAYMFAKGCVLAAADGKGLTQSVAQLIIESLMLCLLLWSRPYERRAGNVINIFIQIVRVLSVVCILVFVEELGISQTTQTVTGVVLIAIQSVMTAALGILICVNAIIGCVKVNPHRKRRKAAEKLNRDLDDLTPLDARNSLLMDPTKMASTQSLEHKQPFLADDPAYDPKNPAPMREFQLGSHRPLSNESSDNLVGSAAPMAQDSRGPSLPRFNNQQAPYSGGYKGPSPNGGGYRGPPRPDDGGGYRGMAY